MKILASLFVTVVGGVLVWWLTQGQMANSHWLEGTYDNRVSFDDGRKSTTSCVEVGTQSGKQFSATFYWDQVGQGSISGTVQGRAIKLQYTRDGDVGTGHLTFDAAHQRGVGRWKGKKGEGGEWEWTRRANVCK